MPQKIRERCIVYISIDCLENIYKQAIDVHELVIANEMVMAPSSSAIINFPYPVRHIFLVPEREIAGFVLNGGYHVGEMQIIPELYSELKPGKDGWKVIPVKRG